MGSLFYAVALHQAQSSLEDGARTRYFQETLRGSRILGAADCE